MRRPFSALTPAPHETTLRPHVSGKKGRSNMAIMMGIVSVAVVLAVVLAIVFAGRKADHDAAPRSEPSDFVAPVSRGGFAFRRTDESPEEFKVRIAQENAAAADVPKA